MAIIDRVKWDGSPDILAWKYPSEELATWTQLIVNESQTAYLVRGGIYEGPFGAGRHTLSTENLPLLTAAMSLPFGRRSPFSAEVWYVNRATKLDIKWGTQDPIQLQDPQYKVMVPLRAYGQYGITISDPKIFLNKLVGTLSLFSSNIVSQYFRGVLTTRIKTEIANAIATRGISILTIATQLEELSALLQEALTPSLGEYGVTLLNFTVMSINAPEDDPAVIQLKAALARKAEMTIVGYNYQQERSFDVLQTAAGNEGSAGTTLGAGIGLGMGVRVGDTMGAGIRDMGATLNTASAEPIPPTPAGVSDADRIKMLRDSWCAKVRGYTNRGRIPSRETPNLGTDMTPRSLTTLAGLVAAAVVLGIGAIFGAFRTWNVPCNSSLLLFGTAIALGFWAPFTVFENTRSDAGRIASIGLISVSMALYILGFGIGLLSALIGVDERVTWSLDLLAGALGSIVFLFSGAAQTIIARITAGDRTQS